ncbi:hypothetical protein J2850_003645 [Azospirillum picis]|uniref:Uncharacterized protein n=1 Tax=Azospirillum picis TaxID=488438 RepID=A0ABU0MU65_9PROT|nr:hypothetical protein [Azospirillum picis]MDQ0537035.1 hypothetical protein [Azospirillum picis]
MRPHTSGHDPGGRPGRLEPTPGWTRHATAPTRRWPIRYGTGGWRRCWPNRPGAGGGAPGRQRQPTGAPALFRAAVVEAEWQEPIRANGYSPGWVCSQRVNPGKAGAYQVPSGERADGQPARRAIIHKPNKPTGCLSCCFGWPGPHPCDSRPAMSLRPPCQASARAPPPRRSPSGSHRSALPSGLGPMCQPSPRHGTILPATGAPARVVPSRGQECGRPARLPLPARLRKRGSWKAAMPAAPLACRAPACARWWTRREARGSQDGRGRWGDLPDRQAVAGPRQHEGPRRSSPCAGRPGTAGRRASPGVPVR